MIHHINLISLENLLSQCFQYLDLHEYEGEHLKPHSKGGKTALSNLVLASKQKNQARGNADIRNFANKETIIKYLSQFIDIKIKDFDGNKYINGIIKTLTNLGVIK